MESPSLTAVALGAVAAVAAWAAGAMLFAACGGSPAQAPASPSTVTTTSAAPSQVQTLACGCRPGDIDCALRCALPVVDASALFDDDGGT